MTSKIVRKTQKQFGGSAGASQIAQFGSFAAGSGAFSTDPAVIQNLANFSTGWFGAVTGSYSPALEDMNALAYLFAYQLGYLLQTGVGEWDSATTYFTGSLVNDGSGNLYASLQDSNLNNAVTPGAWWRRVSGGTNIVQVNPASTPTVALASTDSGKTFLVNSANGKCTFDLPAAAPNLRYAIKDVGGAALTNWIILSPAGGTLDGQGGVYIYKGNYGFLDVVCDGTNWWLLNN